MGVLAVVVVVVVEEVVVVVVVVVEVVCLGEAVFYKMQQPDLQLVVYLTC
jgi:hypothetical protein